MERKRFLLSLGGGVLGWPGALAALDARWNAPDTGPVSRDFWDDVRAEFPLHLHRALRVEKHLIAVDRRTECHTRLADTPQLAETEHLKPARVGQDRSLPMHEIMQIAMRADNLRARPQHQVEGITENDLRPGRPHLLRRDRLDRTVGTDRHERGRIDLSAFEAQLAAAGMVVGMQESEVHWVRYKIQDTRGK